MTLEATAFGGDPFRRTATGYEIEVRVPSYRSLPLSCIEGIGVTLAGKVPPPDSLRFRVNGHDYTPAELAEAADEQWFVLDPLTIVVPELPGVADGGEIDLEVMLEMRVPYVIFEDGSPMIQKTSLKRKVSVQ